MSAWAEARRRAASSRSAKRWRYESESSGMAGAFLVRDVACALWRGSRKKEAPAHELYAGALDQAFAMVAVAALAS